MTDLILGLMAVLVAGGALFFAMVVLTGHAKVRMCCNVPVERDLRMRDAARYTEIS